MWHARAYFAANNPFVETSTVAVGNEESSEIEIDEIQNEERKKISDSTTPVSLRKKIQASCFQCPHRRYILPLSIAIFFFLSCSGILYTMELYADQAPGLDKMSNCTLQDFNFYLIIYLLNGFWTGIGYSIIPCTWMGISFGVVFCIVGVPLHLFCVVLVGGFFYNVLRRGYNFMLKGIFPKQKRKEFADIPISLALFILAIWELLTAWHLYYSLYDLMSPSYSWNYLTSIFYTVNLFFTAGVNNYATSAKGPLGILTVFMVFIGLAFLSMTMTIIQMRIDRSFEQIGRNIQKRYKEDLLAQQEGRKPSMATDPRDIDNELKHMWTKNVGGGLLPSFFGGRQRQKLIDTWYSRARMRNASIQTDIVASPLRKKFLTHNLHSQRTLKRLPSVSRATSTASLMKRIFSSNKNVIRAPKPHGQPLRKVNRSQTLQDFGSSTESRPSIQPTMTTYSTTHLDEIVTEPDMALPLTVFVAQYDKNSKHPKYFISQAEAGRKLNVGALPKPKFFVTQLDDDNDNVSKEKQSDGAERSEMKNNGKHDEHHTAVLIDDSAKQSQTMSKDEVESENTTVVVLPGWINSKT